METKKKLMQPLQILAFSILILSSIVLSACCYKVEADYSFHNHLAEDVHIYLYSSGPNLSGDSNYSVDAGGYAMLASLETCDRDGFGDVIGNEVDSAKLVYSGSSEVIAIWRASGEHNLSESFENLPDFYDWQYWEKNRIQHGGSHAEYRYILELAEE